MTAQFSEGYAEADGTRVCYFEAGRGDPLVILHGEDTASPTELDGMLAERYRVIALKLPGTGTPGGGPQAATRNLARTMCRAAVRIGLTRYRLVRGTEGSPVALWQAIDFPEQVESLVLIAPPPADPSEHGDGGGLGSRLGEVQAPTLVVFGTRDTAIAPSTGRFYRERIPNCYYILMYEAGHAIAAERPQALYQLVDDFLERGDAFIVNRTSGLINP
jgi:pimeloyl-ACP methyl ester carboxylesterase